MMFIRGKVGAEHRSSQNRSAKMEADIQRDLKEVKDGKFTPKWDLKIQTEHGAKHPGPPNKKTAKEEGMHRDFGR